MDNSSIRGRYSLSSTNLASPIAESTCLNGLSSRAKFNWGEGTISPRSRSNSQSIVDQNNSTSKKSNTIPAKAWMCPSTRIDPKTYVDIHSNGLASRIVKYHDNSVRLNRSLSMTNLYNKPGQFPVVHLKKTEQQYKAKKTKNLSMTRIAAPEKSAFHGNTLSSILRSGSIVGLQKSDEEISRENRPILHPPPTENEMAPTRSVLEVLKEISRKRINSDEMDGTELTKKQCKEPEQDLTTNIGQRTQSKRQREITNPTTFNAQISPEQQVIKKRMCNYNNDIMSSLSSSMAGVNKKKMLEMQSQKRTASDVGGLNASSSSFTDFEVSRSEKHRCVGNFEIQQTASSTKYTSVAPLPSAPIQNSIDLDSNIRGGIVTRRASEPSLTNTKPKLTLFNKNYDETPILDNDDTEIKVDGDLCGIQFVKPKKSSSISSGGSLLMEKTKKSKLALMLSGLKGELDEEDEVDAVIPKEDQQKAVDASVSTQITPVSSSASSSSLFSTPTITSVSSSKPIVTTKPVVVEDSEAKPTDVTGGLKLNSVSVTSTTSNTHPIPVLSTTSTTLAQQISLPAITTSPPGLSTTSTTTSTPAIGGFSFGLLSPPKTATTIATSTPLLPSSSISQIVTSTSTTSVSVSTPISATGTISTVGTKPFAFGGATTQASATSTPGFSFGTPTTLTQTVPSAKEPPIINAFGSSMAIIKATDSAPPAVFGQSSTSSQPTFSFGSLAAAKTMTNNLTIASAAPATTSTITPTFGSQKTTWNSPSANTSSMNGIGSFGAENVSLLPQSTTALTTTSSTGGFSFGATLSTEAPKSLFGNAGPSNTKSTNSNTTFSFSATKTPANPTNTIGAFAFGAGAQTPAAVPNTALTFGATAAAAVPNVNPPNIFGNTANDPKPTNTFSFGSSAPIAPTQNSAFSFSSSDKNTVAVPAASNAVGGFSFNNSSVSFVPVAESNKNIFGTVAPTPAEPKSAFNFGSSTTTNPNTDKPVVFGGSTNIFGTPATSATPQSSAFTFGSSANEATNQEAGPPNPFGSSGPTSNNTTNLGASVGSNSIFGAPSSTLQQSSTFNFGSSSSNIKQAANKPTAGGFVFGSTSSIGSNASKPALDMNKTFVFGDSNTTIKPSSTTNVFGGSNGTNNSINGATDNKMFSFGSPAPSGINNTFATGRQQTVNPAPAFNFGAVAPVNNAAPAPNGNLFAPQGQAPTDRPIKKATRRLHKT